LIAVGGVIGKAIAAALRQLGARPRDLPFCPRRLWRLIHEARHLSASSSSKIKFGVAVQRG
jgi:hypothetical protein